MRNLSLQERLIWLSLCGILLFGLGISISHDRQSNLRATQAERRTYMAFQKQEELNQHIRVLETELRSATIDARTQEPPPSAAESLDNELEDLKAKGLKHPAADLIADLQKHPELIPYEGVLGGTMGFGEPKEIQILNSHWVLAGFEDGHIGGKLLLEFTVSDYGKISWKILGSYMDGAE